MDQLTKMMQEKKPYFAMVTVQIIFAFMPIVSKAAFNGGMSTFVFAFYRQAIAAVILLPAAIIFERKTAPPLPLRVTIKILMLSMFGYTINLNMHSIAIKLTSATVASASTNLIPVFTFILAVLFRVEIIRWRRASGIAKIIGVVTCLGGALILALYKGPHFNPFVHHNPILHGSSQNHPNASMNKMWVVGTFLMVLVAFCWALWIVLQGIVSREYPSWLWSSALVSLFSSVQCFVVAVVVERNMSKWKLRWDDGLIAVAYNGVLVAGLVLYLQTWCIQKKGPVFTAMFYPLALIITVITSSFLLGEAITLGSVLGGALLVGGLYCVLWGKSRERSDIDKNPEVAKINSSNAEMVKGNSLIAEVA